MTFELAPVDGLNDEQLAEMANLFAEKCQKAAQQTVKDAIVAGNALNTLKQRIPHGQWVAWLGANFDYSRQTAATYMTLAANVKRFTFEPESIRQAMAMIASEQAEIAEAEQIRQYEVPRTERKTGCVEVASPPEPVSNADEFDENAVPPEPKTNTKHSKATAKAKEADRPLPQVVTPDIVEEAEPSDPIQDWIETHTLADLVTLVLAKTCSEDDDAARKKAAKQLRKMADQLDPPRKPRMPDLDECLEFFQGLGSDDGEQFYDFYQSKGWLVGKVPMKDWQAAGRRWIRENQKGTYSNAHSTPKRSTAQAREQSNADAFAIIEAAVAAQRCDGHSADWREPQKALCFEESGTIHGVHD